MKTRQLAVFVAGMWFVQTGWLQSAPAVLLDDLVAGAKKEGNVEFYASPTLTAEGSQKIADAAQGKKVVYMRQDQAEMINRLTTLYSKILGFTR